MKKKVSVLTGIICLVLSLMALSVATVCAEVAAAPAKTVKIGCSAALQLSWGVEIKNALDIKKKKAENIIPITCFLTVKLEKTFTIN